MTQCTCISISTSKPGCHMTPQQIKLDHNTYSRVPIGYSSQHRGHNALLKYFKSGYERLPANGSKSGVYDDLSQFNHFLCQDDFDLIRNKSFVPPMLWNKVGTFEYAKKGYEIRAARTSLVLKQHYFQSTKELLSKIWN